MIKKQVLFSIILVLSLLLNALEVVVPALAAGLPVVDDFESGLPTGKDANNISVGFVTFNDPNSIVGHYYLGQTLAARATGSNSRCPSTFTEGTTNRAGSARPPRLSI